MDNDQWIRRFRTGDQQTLQDVYDVYSLPLRYFANKYLSNEQEAEELVSDTLVKLWARHENFNTIENIKAFIYISIKNNCLDVIKKNKRKAVREQKFVYHAEKELRQQADHRLIQSQLLQKIHEEIEKLPPQCRQIFKLSYFEEKNNEEISTYLQISINTVKSQKARARRHLRTALLKEDLLYFLIYLALFESRN